MKLIKTYPLKVMHNSGYKHHMMIYDPKLMESIWFEIDKGT